MGSFDLEYVKCTAAGELDRMPQAQTSLVLQLLKSGRSTAVAVLVSIALACWLRLALRWRSLCADWSRRKFLRFSSSLSGSVMKLAVPSESHSTGKIAEAHNGECLCESWSGFCPICKRPIDAQLSSAYSTSWTSPESRGRYAYVITIWGSAVEYVLGAMVLGHSLKRTGSRYARVCLYADDVPPAMVALLSQVWDCRLVEHVKVASSHLSFEDAAVRFEKVFTKLRVLGLVEFEKVLLLDIDLIIMSNIDDLFQLPAPAAMRRGMNDGYYTHVHGDPIDGKSFFLGSDHKISPWGQATGINAGVMFCDRTVVSLKLCWQK